MTLARPVAALIAIAIAVATLWPMPDVPQPGEVFCVICGTLGGIDFLANIGLFVPLGVALRAGGIPFGRVVALGVALSLTIEALQWQLVAGRDASAGDLLANTLGTALGARFATGGKVLLRPSRRIARTLAVGWTVVVAVAGFVAGWALLPAVPDLRYWSQWEPVRHSYAPFTGKLQGLRLFGHPVPNGEMIDPTREDSRYSQGLLDVAARVVPGSGTAATMLIARAGNPLGEQFELAQRGTALLFRPRSNAAHLSLRSPTFTLPGAFEEGGHEPHEIRAQSRPGSVDLEVRRANGTTAASTFPVTLGLAWQTVSPVNVSSIGLRGPIAMGALVLAFLPLAYWAAGGVAFVPAMVWLTLTALGLLIAVPRLTGIATGGRWESLGVATGVGLGIVLARRFSAARASATDGHPAP